METQGGLPTTGSVKRVLYTATKKKTKIADRQEQIMKLVFNGTSRSNQSPSLRLCVCCCWGRKRKEAGETVSTFERKDAGEQ